MRTLIVVLTCLMLASCAQSARTNQAELKDQIRTVLKENPELVMEVLRDNKAEVYTIVEQGVAERRRIEAEERLKAELEQPKTPSVNPMRPIRGPEDAPVTVVEYSDFLCPYCSKGAETVKQLMEKYPEKVRLVFKHNPRNDLARALALTFEAVARQDEAQAWKFHDLVFANQQAFQQNQNQAIQSVLAQLDIDMKKLNADLADPKLRELIRADEAEAAEYGFSGTPMFLVNGVSVRGAQPLAKFEETIGVLEQQGLVGPPAASGGEDDEICLDCLEEE